MEPPTETWSSPHLATLRLTIFHMVSGMCIFALNVTERSKIYERGYGMAMVFSSGMVVMWALVLYGIYHKSLRLLKMARNLWIVFVCLWLYIVIMCLASRSGIYCVGSRCPYSFWLTKLLSSKTLYTENHFEYYDHIPHDHLISTAGNSEAGYVTPRTSALEYHPFLTIKLYNKYFTRGLSLSLLIALFTYSWMNLRRTIKDVRNRLLCPQCYKIRPDTLTNEQQV